MGLIFSACIAFLMVIFLIHLFNLIRYGRLILKYSLLWLLLCILVLICDAFPCIASYASEFAGFITASNLIFLIAINILTVICFSPSIAVSRSSVAIKNLSQEVALLEKEVNLGKTAEE